MAKDMAERICAAAKKKYGSEREYLWARNDSSVLRRGDNKKWYACFIRVKRSRLGLDGDGEVDIIDVKCDPMIGGSLRSVNGYLPAYHMNKSSWITILLDGTVPLDDILAMLDVSYGLAASGGGKRQSSPTGKKSWLIPANPRYYDIEQDFKKSPVIDWKQTSRVAVGDIVYIYMGAPVSSVLYKCRAIEVDIPYSYSDDALTIKKAMRIELIRRYEGGLIGREKLAEHGVHAVRSARFMPQTLCDELDIMDK